MDWKPAFRKAVESFKTSKFDEALEFLNRVGQAVENGGGEQYVVLDSRSAVYSKLGEMRLALLDAKKVIQLAPTRWQGYSRAARLFLEVERFEEARKMADAALSRLPPEDTKARSSLVSLIGEIKETRRRVTCHMANLPYDLLIEIFRYLVDYDALNILLVSRISKQLRNVALISPSLWGTLVLTNKSPVRKSSWWIERSKGRIRELCLRRTLSDDGKWTLENLEGIQWSGVRILRLEDFDLVDYLRKREDVEGVLPSLEEIDIKDKLLDSSRDPFIAQFASQVRRLTLEGSYVAIPKMSTNSLTHLTLRRVTPCRATELLNLLSANPQLQELYLEGSFTFQPHTAPASKIFLLNLTTLEACCQPQLFRFLFLPALEVFRFRRSTDINIIINSLVASSTTSLTEISIVSCAVSTPLILQLLGMNPLLTTLVLNHLASTSNAVVEALVAPSQTSPLCPALTHLDVSYCPDVGTGPLSRLVKNRRAVADEETPSTSETSSQRPAALQTIRVDGCPGIDPDFLPWFRQRVPSFSCVYMSKKDASWKR
ncbi:hypothetical protein V5O48_001361 [Marasmius crinis-equi]|uniref:F-box domain-containing protein n=1 Tax=Marasmius crinis-equi TaxID=585013 RepID=A0ABR3FYM6_9AGAR